MTNTKYLWYLCDDDTVLEGCVDTILSAIEKYDPSVAIFNCTWVNPYGVLSKAGVDKDIVYKKISDLENYKPLMRMTFLSIVVFEKRIDADYLKSTNYEDNIFIQLTLGLLILSDRFKYVEVAEAILHRNVGFKYGEFFKFYLVDHLKAVFLAKHRFDNGLFIKWSREHLFTALELYLAQKIGLFKYNGSPSKETLKLLWKYYGFYVVFIALFKPLYFLVPSFLLKFLYYLKLRSIHGAKLAGELYRANIDRAFTDKRKTGFTAYR